MEGDTLRGRDRGKSRLLVWLHRIGYLTTAIVAAELGLIGFVEGRMWLRERELNAILVEQSRTHEEPLQESRDPYVRGSALKLLASLPPLGELHGDGFRFIAMPSFGTSDYALTMSLAPQALRADGLLIVIDKTGRRSASARHFAAPAADYRKLVADLDRLTDGWPGDDNQCLDGAPAAFERVRGTRVTSGIGNCGVHYAKMKLIVLKALRRFAPGTDLPTEDDWHRFEPKDRGKR